MFIRVFSDSQGNLQFLRKKPMHMVPSDLQGRNNCDSCGEERFVVYIIAIHHKELPEQSDPWFPSLHVHNPVV